MRKDIGGIRAGRLLLLALLMGLGITASAQVGEHRNNFSIGVNGGYLMSSVKFTPKVPQGQHGGMTGGVSFRYVCEKYFKTICSVYAEVNYAQAGWKEDILTKENDPVLIDGTQEALAYSRTINYVQIPVFAHLAWGREERGINFFVNAGPQFGVYLSESTTTNFDLSTKIDSSTPRVSSVVAQDTMAVENKFDYGIALGVGAEYSIPKVGHILAEVRYYYGLGSIYGTTKRDNFGTSNFGQIVFKLAYLFDINKKKKN